MSEETPLPLATRLWFAWACLVRILFDGQFAARVFKAAVPALPPPEPEPAKLPEKAKKPAPEKPAEPDLSPALSLLALLQREGRLVDFLEQDIATFPDAEIGAAVRVVHEGCRKALHDHLTIVPVRSEEEGHKVTLEAGFSPAEVKLTGNVQGKPPYRGTIQHRGWRVTELRLPTPTAGHDPKILAPAEVEL
ncbi:DUF2760 domain-containing protein [Polyangium sorediatum]|uniref:DUF2760 domain-containing protein n=1 Tax=Polyangium sorediatum TaxID=889274 RepID=A0ABT6NP77_9BACT|nr:DUF2760 domain-containing protein [Polyangium sorediatum]MDI1430081.1 DUF2760 domain-containing protein [Polyangium sorediatum]